MVLAGHPRYQHPGFDRDRFVDHALPLRVVTHFDVTDQRKILAERMADKAVIGQDATQVRVPAEQDAEQVESLALVPVGTLPDTGDGRQHRKIIIGSKYA